jgi:hypothetical protein
VTEPFILAAVTFPLPVFTSASVMLPFASSVIAPVSDVIFVPFDIVMTPVLVFWPAV